MAQALHNGEPEELIMKGLNKNLILKNFILLIVLFFGSQAAFANNRDVASTKIVSEQTLSTIADNLSKKLRVDLADNSISVKINDIEKQELSKTLVNFKGSAYC